MNPKGTVILIAHHLQVSIAENALSIADDDDLPLLFKTLIKCMDHINSAALSVKLKNEIANLPLESVALVLEVLWEALPNSHKAADCLLHSIHQDAGERMLCYNMYCFSMSNMPSSPTLCYTMQPTDSPLPAFRTSPSLLSSHVSPRHLSFHLTQQALYVLTCEMDHSMR